MATATLILPIAAATPADGTTGNEFPAISIVTSSDADNPKARMFVAAFDDTTAETLSWSFRMPANYASGGTFKGQFYMAGANTGTKYVAFAYCVQAVTPGDSTAMTALDPAGSTGGGWYLPASVTVSNTAGYLTALNSNSPNADSAVAGDSVIVMLQRVPTSTNPVDDAVGDCMLVGDIHFEYTTT